MRKKVQKGVKMLFRVKEIKQMFAATLNIENL